MREPLRNSYGNPYGGGGRGSVQCGPRVECDGLGVGVAEEGGVVGAEFHEEAPAPVAEEEEDGPVLGGLRAPHRGGKGRPANCAHSTKKVGISYKAGINFKKGLGRHRHGGGDCGKGSARVHPGRNAIGPSRKKRGKEHGHERRQLFFSGGGMKRFFVKPDAPGVREKSRRF